MTTTTATFTELILDMGMTQREFAAKVGVHPITLGNWIHGRFSPRPQYLRKMSEILSRPIPEIRTMLSSSAAQ